MSAKLSTKSATLSLMILALVAVIEGPVRVFLQPDPWLLHPSHWYFEQPMRIMIEAVIVGFLLLVLTQTYRNLLSMGKEHLSLLVGAALGSIVLFSFLELDQLKSSLDSPVSHIITWGLTGVLIGVGQELVYRGLLYTSLTSLCSTKIAALITTLLFIFAPLHSVRLWDLFVQGEHNVVLLLVLIYAAAGMFFQWLRDKSQSLIVPAVAHGLGNGITWLAVFS